MKKIKATISKPTISTLKFQRKSDFNKLLKFIEKETKELKNIKIPKRSEIKSKKKGMNLFGLGLLGLVGILGAGFGGGEDEKEVKEVKEEGFGIDKFMIGRVEKSKKGGDGLKQLEDFGKSTNISARGFKKFPLFNKNPFKNIKFGSAANATTLESGTFRYGEAENTRTTTTTSEVGGNTTNTKKSSTATIDKNQGKQGPTGGTKGRLAQKFGKNYGKDGSGKVNMNKIDINKIFERGKNINKKLSQEGFNPNIIISDKTLEILKKSKQVFMNTDGIPLFRDSNNVFRRFGDLSFAEKTYYVSIQKAFESLEKTSDLRTAEEILKNKSKTTVKPNIFKRFMNFYNKGRNVRFPDENNAKLKDLIKDDFSQVTYSDSAFKSGKKGFFNLRPFKAFTPNMLKTGPTPLTRQIIERPFRSLLSAGSSVTKFGSKILKSVNKDFAKALFKSKTKTGLFFVDLFFVGQSFYDLFLRPGDNVSTTVQDFFIAINNAVYRNNPEKLKYFVTRSKSSAPLFGVSNDMIRQKEINRNLKIKELKEAAAKTSITGGNSNNQNIVVVPQTTNNNKRGSGIRNKTTGGKKASFVPVDLRNPLADQIEYKLSK